MKIKIRLSLIFSAISLIFTLSPALLSARVNKSTVTLQADKINIKAGQKAGEAEGNVRIEHGSNIIEGEKAVYYWGSSSATLVGASGISPPWRFSADKMIQRAPGLYLLTNGIMTSCDHDPPHFRFRSRKSKVMKGKRTNMNVPRFIVEDAPTFWLPFYSRSLEPKKYTLRVEPGSSGRDGLKVKTIWGYPITANSYTKIRWDYLQRTGNGIGLDHRYYLPNTRGRLDAYYIRDVNSDPRPKGRRHTAYWNHYQRFSKKLTMNARVDVKSDQEMGNQFSGTGNRTRIENSVRGIFSTVGFRYQMKKASLGLDMDRRDRFDSSVSSKSFISKVTYPRVTFNTAPLEGKYLPFYTSFNGTWVNETTERTDPDETLRYQQSASGGMQIKKDIRVARRWTFTPRLGYTQSWKDRDLSIQDSESDIYQGRYNTGMDVRRRLWRMLDITIGHSYTARLAENSTNLDSGADDRGIETNQMRGTFVSRVGRTSRLTLSSGYDMRRAPRNVPTKYFHRSERILDPSLDIQWQITKKVGVFFRETYSLFNTSVRHPVRTPANTSGEFQIGDLKSPSFFSSGFSYTKGPSGADSVLNLTHKIRFYFTSKWYIDALVSYRAVGTHKLNYSKFLPTEKTIHVARDLHCWLLRMSFSERVDRREASFHIDLKSNLGAERDVFQRANRVPFFPYGEDDLKEFELFTEEEKQPQMGEE